MLFLEDGYGSRNSSILDHFSSQKDVLYSKKAQPIHLLDTFNCGSCGYALNLNSSNRNTTNLGSKYKKSIKKGVITFYTVDEGRFSQMEELKCIPRFIFKDPWGLFRKRTKLLCRKCGNYIGKAYEERAPSSALDNSDTSSGSSVGVSKKYNIRIKALQPASDNSDNSTVS